MYKLILLMVTLGTASGLQAQSNVRLSYDLSGRGKAAILGQGDYYDVAPGYSFGAEYLSPVYEYITLGAGLNFQSLRRLDGPDSNGSAVSRGKIGFIPLYFIGMAQIPSEKAAPYVKLTLGYNWMIADKRFTSHGKDKLGGDITAGAGLGVIVKKRIIVEGMLQFHAGTVESEQSQLGLVDFNVEYFKVSLTIGYIIGKY